jgi:hypothetical protein
MSHPSSPRRQVIFWTTVICLTVSALCLIIASPQRKPAREQVTLDDTPVVVDYAPAASTKDLMLPFYPGATEENSFTYRVNTKEGKRVTYYASAILTSADPPERVSRWYSDQLPGKPRPALISDRDGARQVLAIGSQAEVRKVTITAGKTGSRIELVRAFGHSVPPKPLRPRGKQQVA